MGILGFIILAILVVFGLKDNLSAFIDVPSLLIVVCLTLGALLFSYGSALGRAFKAASGEATQEDLVFAITFWDKAISYALAAALLGAWSAWSTFCPAWMTPKLSAPISQRR